MKAVLSEVTIFLQSLNVGVTAVQWSAVSMSTTAHILVTIGTGTLAAFVNRQSVTPNVKIGA